MNARIQTDAARQAIHHPRRILRSQLLTDAARFGTLVRGVVLCICGLLVIEAAVTGRADRVGGIGDALSTVETTAMGAWLLGIAGLGFVAYGAYQLAKVRYRRVRID